MSDLPEDLDIPTQSLFKDDCGIPDIDELFSQLPEHLGLATLCPELPRIHGYGTRSSSRFGPLVTESQVTALQKAAVPMNTKKNTNWACKVWSEWAANRKLECPTAWPPHLMIIKPCELNLWLSRFVLEVRRQDGQPYPPNTLHQLCCGILRQVREIKPELDIFKDPEFVSFRKTLDAEMKRLKASAGVRLVPKQAEPITETEEEMLWEKGLLGSHSPQSLIDTMVFMAGMYFALRSGEEHRQLRFSSIELIEKPRAIPYLLYTELDNPGGLKHRKVTSKQVTHHANTECPTRCFVQMYKQYCSHRPENVKDDAFYLAPIPNAKGQVWYRRQAIGIHALGGTVKRLCEQAGIKGYKTNHSLRVTAATRLFLSGMDEQLIMERTGHRSTDGVRAYKRSSLQQQALVSRVLNGETRSFPKPKEVTVQVLGNEEKENRPTSNATACQPDSAVPLSAPNLPTTSPATPCQQSSALSLTTPSATTTTPYQPNSAPPVTTPNHPATACQPRSAFPPAAPSCPATSPTFSGCSGITSNYNFGPGH